MNMKIDAESNNIAREASSFRTLEQVLSWTLTRRPPAELLGVIAQDEFTHDVIVRVSNEVFLVFDTN